MTCDYLIVGAGLFGSVLAERIASERSAHVVLLDRRPHIGGNCWSEIDPETGIEYHRYGSHIFHTDSRRAWEYLNRFTTFNDYRHRVETRHGDRTFPLPINLDTINAFYGRTFTPTEAESFLTREAAREAVAEPANFEEQAISLIGRPLYEALLRGYTRKQWNREPRELSAAIMARLPVRFDHDRNYFQNSRWQGIPREGYGRLFARMLAADNIDIVLDCDWFEHRHEFHPRCQTIYTGPIDRYFDCIDGRLDWRSVRFEREVMARDDFQGISVMNYADVEVPFTRIHEPKHLHPERDYKPGHTVIFREFPHADRDEPYYPVDTQRNRELLRRYRARAANEKVIFGGRLGDYAYYDMDRTICAALQLFEERIA
ncbi:MAG: UDP-galactopyranose mutase [bacterium]